MASVEPPYIEGINDGVYDHPEIPDSFVYKPGAKNGFQIGFISQLFGGMELGIY